MASSSAQYLNLPIDDYGSIASSSSSHSTFTGLGTTSGKFFMVVGEFIRRGIELAVSHHRLGNLSYDLAPAHAMLADKSLYLRLLEFSRSGMYSAAIRRKAWDILVLLIQEENTANLACHLLDWDEADMFLLDMLRIMPAGWINVNGNKHRTLKLRKEFRDLQHPNSTLALHVMRFLTRLSQALQTSIKLNEDNEGDTRSLLSSYVDASGKMILGPGVYLRGTSMRVARLPLHSLVSSIICARLNQMSTILSTEPSFTSLSPQSINIHAELLEVFRSMTHDRTLQIQTRELIFISLTRSYAAPLAHVLTTWSKADLHILITRVMRWLRPFVQESCSIDCKMPRAYLHYLANHTNGEHPVIPFLYFLTRLCIASPLAASLCMELDLIRLLKTMCINNFPNPASRMNASKRVNKIAMSDVHSILTMLLGALSLNPKSCMRLLQAQDIPLWFLSLYYSPDFIGLPNSALLQDVWMELEKPLLKLILVSMELVLKRDKPISTREADFLPLQEVYRDIVGVLRENKSEPEVMYSASDSFLRCIAIGGEFRRLMDAILAEGSSNDTHIIITVVLKSLGLYSFLPPTLVPPSILERKHPVHDLREYIGRLARFYSDELKLHTSLVAELIGSEACNARYMLIDIYQNSGQPHITDNNTSSCRDALGHTYALQISSVQNVTV